MQKLVLGTGSAFLFWGRAMRIFNDRLFVEMYSSMKASPMDSSASWLPAKPLPAVEIVDTHVYAVPALDGKMQSSQVDEHIYHELLVHPAMVTHPAPRKILIIGGGEGATLREVLRHASVEQVDMLEIDEQVVTFAKRHLADWHRGAFDDPRLHLIIGDGRRHVEETPERYDLIFIDVSDPGYDGPAYLLYTLQFYQTAARCLRPDGLIAMQAGPSSPTCGEIMASIYRTLGEVFPVVGAYEAFIPSFGYPWGFCLGSRQLDPGRMGQEEVDQRLRRRSILDLKAYDVRRTRPIILNKTCGPCWPPREG
jgi:spermidine synthase